MTDYTPEDVREGLRTIGVRSTEDVHLPDGEVRTVPLDDMPDDVKAALIQRLTGEEPSSLNAEQDARVTALFHARSVILQEEPGKPFSSGAKRVHVGELLTVARFIIDGYIPSGVLGKIQ